MSSTAGGRPLRIALIDSWHRTTARGSGTAASIAGLAAALARQGHAVTVHAPERIAWPLTARRLWFNWRLRHRAGLRSCDVVVGFDIDGVFLPRAGAPPFVLCLKGVAADEMRFERGRPRLALGLLAAVEARNARSAALVVVPSEYSARIASAAYGLAGDAIAVVPEGIDLAPWEALHAARPARADAAPTILSVARQYPRKDTRTLIRALPRVAAEIPDVRLRVIGGGPELPALRVLAAELGVAARIRFDGEVPDDDDVRRAFFLADVFCLPSRQEGFGIVFLEAMAAGLPVVAAEAGAVPEVVRDGREALLVPPGDADALAAALIRLLRDGALRRRLGESGRERVRAFELGRVTGEFVQRLRTLSGDAARPRAGASQPPAR